LRFGLNFVVLALWVPMEAVEAGGLAIPIGFRLYRSKKTCPPEAYTKRTELAAELIEMAAEWWSDRQLVVAVDQEYTCKTLLRQRPDSVEIVGRLKAGNVVYDPDFEPNEVGRPRKWGDRLGTLETLATDSQLPWLTQPVEMYGEDVVLQVKWLEVQWKSAHADERLTVLIIRDPSGTYDDAYFVRTSPDADVSEVIGPACKRWGIEVAFRNCKQHMRISSVQNEFAQGDEPNDPNERGPTLQRAASRPHRGGPYRSG